jgi:hypothetical protein
LPRHQAFHRTFNRLTPETLRALNQAAGDGRAVEFGIEIDRLQRQSARNHAHKSLPKSRPSAKPAPATPPTE